MKPGPIQTKWLENLRAYPNRQMKHSLGTRVGDNYQACCLGELLLTYCRVTGRTEPWDNNLLFDGFTKFGQPQFADLRDSYEAVGLFDPVGSNRLTSLANLNDGGKYVVRDS